MFVNNFEHIWRLLLVFLFMTLNKQIFNGKFQKSVLITCAKLDVQFLITRCSLLYHMKWLLTVCDNHMRLLHQDVSSYFPQCFWLCRRNILLVFPSNNCIHIKQLKPHPNPNFKSGIVEVAALCLAIFTWKLCTEPISNW